MDSTGTRKRKRQELAEVSMGADGASVINAPICSVANATRTHPVDSDELDESASSEAGHPAQCEGPPPPAPSVVQATTKGGAWLPPDPGTIACELGNIQRALWFFGIC